MKDLLKMLICWGIFAFSLIAGGTLDRVLRLPLTAPGHQTGAHLVALLLAGLALVAGLIPLVNGLAARFVWRAAAAASFVFLALGVNTVIEARVFSSMLNGTVAGTLMMDLVQATMLGVALASCYGGEGRATGLRHMNAANLLGRGVAAWLGWPLIYFAFGMCVAPIVIPYYQSDAVAGLHIPSGGTILATQLVRSVIFLVCSIPLVALWNGSRLGLWGALGLAHAVAVGGYGLIAGTFLPTVLRVAHGIEITCDSFAYAALLTLLLSGAGVTRSARQPVRIYSAS